LRYQGKRDPENENQGAAARVTLKSEKSAVRSV